MDRRRLRYLALAIAATVSSQSLTVRAAWIGMECIGWFVIVPLGCLAFLTGLLMSLGTAWGLLQHYWVIIAFVFTAVALAILLMHMPSVSAVAALARTGDETAIASLGGDIPHAALGLVVLLVVAVLNIYKPRGLTRYGQRRRAAQRSAGTAMDV